MSRWGALVTLAQKKALVIEMSSRFSRLMQTAAELNMHHVRPHKQMRASIYRFSRLVPTTAREVGTCSY